MRTCGLEHQSRRKQKCLGVQCKNPGERALEWTECLISVYGKSPFLIVSTCDTYFPSQKSLVLFCFVLFLSKKLITGNTLDEKKEINHVKFFKGIFKNLTRHCFPISCYVTDRNLGPEYTNVTEIRYL